MVKRKLEHFAENLTFTHLFQVPFPDPSEKFALKGNWKPDYFGNNHPLTLELGCGKGEYTVNLARMNPARNFIGIDIKGARLWKGCKMVQEEGLKNVAFIRSRAEFIGHFFDKDEVDEIWLTFPDPFPKMKSSHRRLTSPPFLDRISRVLHPEGIIHLKTDNEGLYLYTLEIIKDHGHRLVFSSEDIYSLDLPHEATLIQTFYEAMFRKKDIPIKFLEFRLNHGK